MPFFIEYFIKSSIGLTVLALKYWLLLKPLTFYRWNRFYLLVLSVLSMVLPFINVTPVLESQSLADNIFVQTVPVLSTDAAVLPFIETNSLVRCSDNAFSAWFSRLAIGSRHDTLSRQATISVNNSKKDYSKHRQYYSL